MHDANPPTDCPVRTILGTKFSPDSLFLVEDRDHADDGLAPWFRAHIVVNAAQGHCKMNMLDAIYADTDTYIQYTYI